jgi:hypothetical protein
MVTIGKFTWASTGYEPYPSSCSHVPTRAIDHENRGITFVQNCSIDFIRIGCGTRLL